MKVTRRTFLKGIGVAGGGLVASRFLYGPLETLVAGPPEQAALEEKWLPTTCWIGKQDCGLLARTIGGRVVKLEGNPAHPRNVGTLCPKGVGQITALYDYNRVKTPIVRTNGKGIPGQWRQASWDEALTLVSDKIKEARARDPKLVLWQKGRSKQEAVYDNAFVGAIGSAKAGHGAYCSDAGYRAAEYTIGLHGNAHPDFRYTRYLLSWGWNITNAGGNKLCNITWNQQLNRARERGMKVVHIDPRLRSAGPFADEWLPIKPGTDLALALALCQAIIAQGTIDQEYLKKYTNAPFLVQADGTVLRADAKEQVWDLKTSSSKALDAADVEPALEGEFSVGDAKVKPAFQVFKEHVAQYTPQWAAGVTGVEAEKIQQVARELGENAMIGSTIVLDGVTLPYRPVAVMAYHVSQQELGFQFYRAMYMVMMLLGSMEAVGGTRVDFTWKVHANYKALDEVQIKDGPYSDYSLKNSKFFPINTGNPGIIAKVMLDPQKYEVSTLPEVVILHMTNGPGAAFPDTPTFMEAYKTLKFVAAIDPWLSRTADLFADVVLPASTLEKYEGPIGGSDQYTDATVFRVPVMDPLFDSKGELDIYLDLCEKAGLLYGKDGFLDRLNTVLGLKNPDALDLNTKVTARDVADRWAKTQKLEGGITYFEKNGVWLKGPVSAKKIYGFAADPPFNGIRHRMYGEALLRYQGQMRAKGAEKIYWQDYTPLPTWREPTMSSSPSEYDLTLISFKKIEFKQSRGSQMPLLAELAPRQRLTMNPAAARQRGISEGDDVWVESHNAVTGESRKVQVAVELTEGIRPDVVGMPHHYGEIARHPWSNGQGPTPNTLFFTGEGYVTNTADNSFHVRVRVYKG